MKISSKGFTIIEGLLIIIIMAIVGGVGYYVYRQNTDTADKDSSQSYTSQKTDPNGDKSKDVDLKEYKNEEYGFSFQYPANWALEVELADIGRGQKEGDITVTSPNKTVVRFNANLGGKGGDCWDDQANDRTTRTCQTRKIYSVEKLQNDTSASPVYLYHVSITEPTRDGGKTAYMLYMRNGEFAPTEKGEQIGAALSVSLLNLKSGQVEVTVTGKDDTKKVSEDYFASDEAKEASSVLRTFKAL